MMKISSLIVLTLCLSCNEGPKQDVIVKAIPATDTTSKDYSKIIQEKEQASIQKNTDTIGELIKKIEFNVKANDIKDYEDGFIPWAEISKPETDIPNLIGRNEIVIADTLIKIIIDYPLTNSYEFILSSKNGFTRAALLREISKHYYQLYSEEEKSATIKTVPVNKRTKMYNRNETNGKYGIWGHDIADLVLDDILVHKTGDGKIILILEIES